jgi:hypothetical protein
MPEITVIHSSLRCHIHCAEFGYNFNSIAEVSYRSRIIIIIIIATTT